MGLGATRSGARSSSRAGGPCHQPQGIPSVKPYGLPVRMLSGKRCIVTHERPDEPLIACVGYACGGSWP